MYVCCQFCLVFAAVKLLTILLWELFLRFDPPLVPKDFEPHHKFPGPLETDFKVADAGPPEVSPPEDSNLRLLIDGVATLVARCGKLFEDLSREKNQSNPLFSFLLGGNGHDYYTRKLWEARQKRADQTKHQLDGKVSPSMQKLTAESRGQLLGERPLERSFKDASSSVASSDSVQLQYNLSETFTKPISHVSRYVCFCLPFCNVGNILGFCKILSYHCFVMISLVLYLSFKKSPCVPLNLIFFRYGSRANCQKLYPSKMILQSKKDLNDISRKSTKEGFELHSLLELVI